MKKNIKKIIKFSIIILSVTILVIAGLYTYLQFRPYNIIRESVVSFKYPKGLEIKKDPPSQDGGYVTYQIRTEFKNTYPSNESIILIEIPIKDTASQSGGLFTLRSILQANDIKEENFIMPIKEIEINGNEGEMTEYRLDREFVGAPPTHSIFSEIYLNS
ncbi:hypothetical protein L6278_00840, partial [Candidatus Parcubacteria bacterium]|nr:hypothetical protein [Candidatus Parcubacteria bacterium]